MDEIMTAIAKARGFLACALAHLDAIPEDLVALKDALGAHDGEAVADALVNLHADAAQIIARVTGDKAEEPEAADA